MLSLTDIHCHTLSRIDDGAENSTVMKKMIDIAYLNGTRKICFTPHFKIHEFRCEADINDYNSLIKQIYGIANDYVKEFYPDMTLYLGNEVMYHSDLFSSLSNGLCKTLNDSVYILLEFNPNISEYDLKNAVSRILRRGFIPILAHIERYEALIKNFELLLELKGLGALFQVNAKSITDIKFGKTARFLKKAFNNGLVHIIASDAHDNDSFTPSLSRAFSYISKHFGETYAKRIFCDIPTAVLNNEKNF